MSNARHPMVYSSEFQYYHPPVPQLSFIPYYSHSRFFPQSLNFLLNLIRSSTFLIPPFLKLTLVVGTLCSRKIRRPDTKRSTQRERPAQADALVLHNRDGSAHARDLCPAREHALDAHHRISRALHVSLLSPPMVCILTGMLGC